MLKGLSCSRPVGVFLKFFRLCLFQVVQQLVEVPNEGFFPVPYTVYCTLVLLITLFKFIHRNGEVVKAGLLWWGGQLY